MALEIVDLLAKRLKQEYKLTFAECKTKHTPISGGDVGGSANFESFVERKVEEGKNDRTSSRCCQTFSF